MRRSLFGALALCIASACAQAAPASEETFDTSAGNLIAVLRETPGANQEDETLKPIGNVRATLPDGREVEIATSWFHYLGDMHVRLVFDGERSMQTASPEDLQRLQLSPEQAIEQAVGNLRRRYGSPRVEPFSGRLMQVTGGEPDLVSSHFLDREFWQEVARDYPHGVVVSVPKRGGLLFAAADDELAVVALRFSAAAIFASNDRSRVSSALYLFKDGRWSVYQPAQTLAQHKGS